jgi:hypothetical protein
MKGRSDWMCVGELFRVVESLDVQVWLVLIILCRGDEVKAVSAAVSSGGEEVKRYCVFRYGGEAVSCVYFLTAFGC